MSTQDSGSKAIDNAATPAFVMDGDGMIVEWSAQAAQRFEWRRDEAVGRKLSELLIPQRHRASHEAGLKRFMSGATSGALLNRAMEVTMLHRDGRELTVSIRIGLEETPSGRRFPTYFE